LVQEEREDLDVVELQVPCEQAVEQVLEETLAEIDFQLVL
jgi:hypothetical protein